MSKEIVLNQFQVDSNLMYLIQSITKEKTQEILVWFYGLACDIAEGVTSVPKYQDRAWLRREIKYVYNNSDIPFRMTVNISSANGKMMAESHRCGLICEVSFPRKLEGVDMKEAIAALTETQLGLTGAEDLASFTKPKTRVPIGLRTVRKMK